MQREKYTHTHSTDTDTIKKRYTLNQKNNTHTTHSNKVFVEELSNLAFIAKNKKKWNSFKPNKKKSDKFVGCTLQK